MAKRFTKVSEEKKEIALMPVGDFTMRDLETIEKFKENGLLGVHTLTQTDVERCMALYLDGQSYRQVAQITHIKKDVILYLAHKFSWWELRKDYLEELKLTMPDKILECKIQDQKFLFDLIMAYRKKMGKHLFKYLKTDSDEWMDKIDKKDMGMYFKCVELLASLNAETYTPGDKSLVALNGMGEGVTITKTGANSVEITPKPFSNKLKQFADMKREEEKAQQVPPKQPHDITIQTSTENESEDKNE